MSNEIWVVAAERKAIRSLRPAASRRPSAERRALRAGGVRLGGPGLEPTATGRALPVCRCGEIWVEGAQAARFPIRMSQAEVISTRPRWFMR
jgi:hypothetical protein